MKSVLQKFIRNGNLTFFGAVCVVLTGFGLAYVSLEYFSFLTLKVVGLSLGLGIASIGGFSGRAKALDLKPFTNDPLGWRKAKESYRTTEEAEEQKANKK